MSDFEVASRTVRKVDGWAEIAMSNGGVVLVSHEDVEHASIFTWTRVKRRNRFYAQGRYPSQKAIYLHRLIIDAQPGSIVDHINGDGLDCRRENLRFANLSQNAANSVWKPGKSGFRGVKKNHQKSWTATVTVRRASIRKCGFATPEEAAAAYDALAREHFGEFAVLNFPTVENGNA